MKNSKKTRKSYSVIRKLRNEGKLPEEAEIFVSSISLEDLIALKLEIASKPVNGKLYGIPIGKDVISTDDLLRKYNTTSFFEENA